jgi:hypothetical protein
VGYGRLSIVQLREHLGRRRAIHLGGWYHAIRLVSKNSYSAQVVARGRSDNTNQAKFGHSLVVWQVGEARTDGVPLSYIVSDPDFGSPARRAIPPYCEYDAREVEAMYDKGGLRITYCLEPPPAVDAPPATAGPGVALRFGGQPRSRGLYVVTVDDARQRSSPYIRRDNIIRGVPIGTEFRVAQTSRTGTNVAGSPTWHGDATGTVWMHHSVVRPKT